MLDRAPRTAFARVLHHEQSRSWGRSRQRTGPATSDGALHRLASEPEAAFPCDSRPSLSDQTAWRWKRYQPLSDDSANLRRVTQRFPAPVVEWQRSSSSAGRPRDARPAWSGQPLDRGGPATPVRVQGHKSVAAAVVLRPALLPDHDHRERRHRSPVAGAAQDCGHNWRCPYHETNRD